MVNMTPKSQTKIIGGKVESKGTMFESGHEWFSLRFCRRKTGKEVVSKTNQWIFKREYGIVCS